MKTETKSFNKVAEACFNNNPQLSLEKLSNITGERRFIPVGNLNVNLCNKIRKNFLKK